MNGNWICQLGNAMKHRSQPLKLWRMKQPIQLPPLTPTSSPPRKGPKAKQAAKPAEDPPASDAGSYRSAEEVEADKVHKDTEEPPADE
eukprot:1097285-Amphidinium_carterae.2